MRECVPWIVKSGEFLWGDDQHRSRVRNTARIPRQTKARRAPSFRRTQWHPCLLLAKPPRHGCHCVRRNHGVRRAFVCFGILAVFWGGNRLAYPRIGIGYVSDRFQTSFRPVSDRCQFSVRPVSRSTVSAQSMSQSCLPPHAQSMSPCHVGCTEGEVSCRMQSLYRNPTHFHTFFVVGHLHMEVCPRAIVY